MVLTAFLTVLSWVTSISESLVMVMVMVMVDEEVFGCFFCWLLAAGCFFWTLEMVWGR